MIIYRIKNWDSVYENNRTRELKNLGWIPLPLGHDGDGYTTLMSHENGAALFGAWIAVIQVAAKCDPRGTLVRKSQIPHSSATLSRITRIQVRLLDEMLDVCLTECNWLEIIDLQFNAEIPHDNAGIPHGVAPSCDPAARAQAHSQNRTEQKGIGKKGTNTPRRAGEVIGMIRLQRQRCSISKLWNGLNRPSKNPTTIRRRDQTTNPPHQSYKSRRPYARCTDATLVPPGGTTKSITWSMCPSARVCFLNSKRSIDFTRLARNDTSLKASERCYRDSQGCSTVREWKRRKTLRRANPKPYSIDRLRTAKNS